MTCVLGNVWLEDGASLILNNNAITLSNAFIGERWNASAMTHHANGSHLAMQPFVRVGSTSKVLLGSYCPAHYSPASCATFNSNVTINARTFVEGELEVEIYTEVVMLQVNACAVYYNDLVVVPAGDPYVVHHSWCCKTFCKTDSCQICILKTYSGVICILLQGADMSASTVAVTDVTSQLVFAGYNSRLSSYDAYELVVANRYQSSVLRNCT